MNNNEECYVCTLDEATLRKASEELNEDPRERMSAVNALRQWIQSQNHITSPIDTLTLLAFLRARKFSQLESRKLVDDFISVKTKNSQWFENIDTREQGIQAVFRDGFSYALPKRDKEGRLLLVVNFGNLQPWSGRYTKLDIFRAFVAASLYVFFTDESTQVHGIAVIDDLTGLTMKHQTMFSIDEQRTFYGGWHSFLLLVSRLTKCIPARIKKVWMYNLGSLGDFVFMIMKLVMPEKIQKRVSNVGCNAEGLYKEIPMHLLPSDYLPDDYHGSHAGSVKENIDRMLSALLDKKINERIRYLTDDKFRSDESKRPTEKIEASFRKLTVD